jgi:thioesterase domain-containing protein
MFQATPATFRMLLESGWNGQRHLKVLVGGDALPPELGRTLAAKVESLWNMYGPTETTVWSSLDQIHPDDAVMSIGLPIANTSLYVLNDALEPVPPGCTGGLYIGGLGVARGYHDRPDLTEAAFIPDPFNGGPDARMYRTGDLARRLRDGRLECLGRTDFQVKIRGYRVELGEIESALQRHPQVKQAVVHLARTATDEPSLVGYVVLQDRGSTLPADLTEHLRNLLPHYMVPSAVVALAELPLTPNGKVDRKALPAPLAEASPVQEVTYARTDAEVQIANLFAKHLGLKVVSVDASFFELGGHSLLAVRLMRELNEAFAVDLPVGVLFEDPTVAGLAKAVLSGGGTLGSTVVRLHKGEGQKPPLYFICGIQLYQQLARNLPNVSSYGIYVREEESFLASAGGSGSSVSALAAAYVDAILNHAPHGPYALAGVSFGGLLAFEVARQLREAGEEVSLLVLLDSMLPSALRRSHTRTLQRALRAITKAPVSELLGSARTRLNAWLGPEPAVNSEDDRQRLLWRAFTGPATQAYLATNPVYEGPTLMVRATDRSELGAFEVAPDLGWGNLLTGPFQITDSEGDHLGVLRAPETAALIQRELALWAATRATTRYSVPHRESRLSLAP